MGSVVPGFSGVYITMFSSNMLCSEGHHAVDSLSILYEIFRTVQGMAGSARSLPQNPCMSCAAQPQCVCTVWSHVPFPVYFVAPFQASPAALVAGSRSIQEGSERHLKGGGVDAKDPGMELGGVAVRGKRCVHSVVEQREPWPLPVLRSIECDCSQPPKILDGCQGLRWGVGPVFAGQQIEGPHPAEDMPTSCTTHLA